jgi:hypothetical protein
MYVCACVYVCVHECVFVRLCLCLKVCACVVVCVYIHPRAERLAGKQGFNGYTLAGLCGKVVTHAKKNNGKEWLLPFFPCCCSS